MPLCSIRPVVIMEEIFETGKTVQHIYILHETMEPDLEGMHAWIESNFPDNETLLFGKQYVLENTEDFEIAFKLTWS